MLVSHLHLHFCTLWHTAHEPKFEVAWFMCVLCLSLAVHFTSAFCVSNSLCVCVRVCVRVVEAAVEPAVCTFSSDSVHHLSSDWPVVSG